MRCLNCSAENQEGKFCTNCGSPLIVEPVLQEDSPSEAVLAAPAVEAPCDDQPEAEAVPATPVPGTSSEGILNQAWDDVVHDPSMVKKVALMGLIELVPILNFVNNGYSLRWGRRAAFRTGDKLPQALFGDRTFETGFYVAVIAIAWAIAMCIINVVPLIGLVFTLLTIPFMFLAIGYMAMVEEIGAAFRLKDLWEKGKRSYGGLLAIAYVPALVVGIVASVVSFVVAMLMGFGALGLYGSAYLGVGSSSALALGSASMIFFLALVFAYVIGVLSVMSKLIAYRALGYWMGRMAPEWVAESVEKGADPR